MFNKLQQSKLDKEKNLIAYPILELPLSLKNRVETIHDHLMILCKF